MQGTHSLAAQHGRWGYFGVVSLDIELTSAFRGLRIEFPAEDSEWRAGAEFGIAYAYEKTTAKRPGSPGMSVRVIEIRGHIVDTTQILMAFVAAKAFCIALNVDPPAELRLDEGTGLFIFPK